MKSVYILAVAYFDTDWIPDSIGYSIYLELYATTLRHERERRWRAGATRRRLAGGSGFVASMSLMLIARAFSK